MRGLKDDRSAVLATLRDVRPDVLALTEPPRGPFGPARLRRLADDAGLRVAARARTCALLVRADLPTAGERGVRLRWTPGLTRRGVALAEVAGVRVLVVHLGLRATERAVHVDRMARLAHGAVGPVVVAGDFNQGPSGAARRRLSLHLRDLTAGSGPTYPAAGPAWRIDAVLGRGLAPSGPAWCAGGPDASDHRAVVVDVVVAS